MTAPSRRSPGPVGLIALAFGLGAGVPALSAQDRMPEMEREQQAGRDEHRPAPRLLGLDLYVPVPESNPMTAMKVTLGERLFFDRDLSINRSVSCASCHRPARAFSDTVSRSRGAHGRNTVRNAPSLMNAAYRTAFFRDGRSPTLEATVLQPISNPREMNLGLDRLMRGLRRDPVYIREFAAAFEDGLSPASVAAALASYVRSLRSGDAPIDRFLAGDRQALTADAAAGYRLFVGKANCAACHVGPTLSDGEFHNTGAFVDSGDRGRQLVTGREEDLGAFRTPSLRNVELTAPYMHDGSLRTLEAVIDFYDRGGNPNPQLDPEIRPLGLGEREKEQLRAFLLSLTGSSTRGHE